MKGKEPFIFDEEAVRGCDRWLQTTAGRYIDGREKSLMLDLIAPRRGGTHFGYRLRYRGSPAYVSEKRV